MSAIPHSHLWIGDSRTVVISGPHIQILNTLTGDRKCSTVSLHEEDKNALLKSGPIRCAAIDKSGSYIATTGDDKFLKVWSLEELKLLSSREMPKRPTAIGFTRDTQKIIVSDKFGDVFSYPLHPLNSEAPTSKDKRDHLSSHESRSGGELVLGHASLLTSFLLTSDERYIITADRDEHIRVSWYPEGYSIERFCLGHEKFVSAIHIPSFAPSSLISGGGDPVLKVWDWMSGDVLRDIRIFEAVQEFIRVRTAKPKTEKHFGENDDRERRRRKKGKGRGSDIDVSLGPVHLHEETRSADNDISIDTSQTGGGGGSQQLPESLTATTHDTPVLVVHRIGTLESEGARHIIFNAVGATALFTCQWLDVDGTPTVQNLEFGKPVLDFVITDDDKIFVLLDGLWNGEMVRDETRFVAMAAIVQGQLVETSHENYARLLTSFNRECLIQAGPQELQSLDLYNHLSSLPKNAEVEHDPMDQGILETTLHDDEGHFAESVQGKKLSKKALGRLKHKRALLARTKADTQSADRDSPDHDPPSTKRAKSENDQGMIMDPSGDKLEEQDSGSVPEN